MSIAWHRALRRLPPPIPAIAKPHPVPHPDSPSHLDPQGDRVIIRDHIMGGGHHLHADPEKRLKPQNAARIVRARRCVPPFRQNAVTTLQTAAQTTAHVPPVHRRRVTDRRVLLLPHHRLGRPLSSRLIQRPQFLHRHGPLK